MQKQNMLKEQKKGKSPVTKLTSENYSFSYYSFRSRQAGVNVVYSNDDDCYYYNAYCIENKILRELLSNEFNFLDDALEFINHEFGKWELQSYEEKKG